MSLAEGSRGHLQTQCGLFRSYRVVLCGSALERASVACSQPHSSLHTAPSGRKVPKLMFSRKVRAQVASRDPRRAVEGPEPAQHTGSSCQMLPRPDLTQHPCPAASLCASFWPTLPLRGCPWLCACLEGQPTPYRYPACGRPWASVGLSPWGLGPRLGT